MNRKGKLYFRYGTMGSAKTALLLTTAYNFEERRMKYVCLKPVIDTRDLTNVINRVSAFSVSASGYIMTPISMRWLRNYLRNPWR